MSVASEAHCALTVPADGANVTIGWILLIGGAGSFIPQFISLVQVKSSASLSAPSIFMSCFISQAQFVNGFVLTYYERFVCCKESWSGFSCMVETMSFWQFLSLVMFNIPVFVLYFVYSGDQGHGELRLARILWWCLIVFTIGSTAFAIVIVLVLNTTSTVAFWFGRTMGFCALIANVGQWAPQILQTYKAKSAGAMSITFLFIQAPGAALFAYFLIFAQNQDWTTWLPMTINATESFILLFLCVTYTQREKRWKNRKGSQRLKDHEFDGVDIGVPHRGHLVGLDLAPTDSPKEGKTPAPAAAGTASATEMTGVAIEGPVGVPRVSGPIAEGDFPDLIVAPVPPIDHGKAPRELQHTKRVRAAAAAHEAPRPAYVFSMHAQIPRGLPQGPTTRQAFRSVTDLHAPPQLR